MELSHILLIILTITIFFNGYFIRRKNAIGILVTMLFSQIPPLIDLATIGISQYGKGIANTSVSNLTIATIYIIFFWGMGYIVGGINLKRKDKLEDFPGKTSEYSRFDFDDSK